MFSTKRAAPASAPPREPVNSGDLPSTRGGGTTGPSGVKPTRRNYQYFAGSSFTVWTLIYVALFGYPIVRLFILSFRHAEGGTTLDNYKVLADSSLLKAAEHSLLIGIGTALAACVIAIPMAFLVSRTDLPFKNVIRVLTIMSFAAPSFIAALGWLLLLGPRNGLLNRPFHYLFGWESGPFNAFSPWTIIFMLAFFLYPLVFLQVSAAFDNIDPALENAAKSLGASHWSAFRRITLPLLLPAITSGALLVFVISSILFGPVAILGTPVGFDTIPTAMLKLLSFPPQLETEAVISIPVLLIIAGLIIAQRRVLGARKYTVVGGKPGRGGELPLRRLRIPALIGCFSVFFVGLVMPFGMLVLVSFQKYVGAPISAENFILPRSYLTIWQNKNVVTGFTNSLILAAVVVAFGVAIALVASWLVNRSKIRARAVVAPTMLAPLAVPGAVLGVALVITYGSIFGGTNWILFIAYGTLVTPLAFSFINAGVQQMGPESEEAARSLGANWIRTWWHVTLPILRGSIVGIALVQFVFIFRELDASVFLFSGHNGTTATVLFNFASRGDYQVMGTVSVYILLINLIAVLIASKWVTQNRGLV